MAPRNWLIIFSHFACLYERGPLFGVTVQIWRKRRRQPPKFPSTPIDFTRLEGLDGYLLEGGRYYPAWGRKK